MVPLAMSEWTQRTFAGPRTCTCPHWSAASVSQQFRLVKAWPRLRYQLIPNPLWRWGHRSDCRAIAEVPWGIRTPPVTKQLNHAGLNRANLNNGQRRR